MKKKILSFVLSVSMLFSALTFSSCEKSPTGKDGFFSAENSFEALISSMTANMYTDAIAELFRNNTIKNDYSLSLSGGNLADTLKLEYTSLSSASASKGVDKAVISYLNSDLDLNVYRTNSSAYLDSDALFKKYVDITSLFSESEDDEILGQFLFNYNNSVIASKIKEICKNTLTEDCFTDSFNTITVDDKERELNVISLNLTHEQTAELLNTVCESLKSDDEAMSIIAGFLSPLTADEQQAKQKAAQRLDEIFKKLTDSENDLTLKYSRGIYKNMSVYEDFTLGKDGYVKLLYIFADGKKDTATLDITLAGVKVIDAEYALEGYSISPTRRIHIKTPDSEIKLTAETVSVSGKKVVSNVTLDMIGKSSQHTVSGKLTAELTSLSSFSADFSGKYTHDDVINDITLIGTTDLNSSDRIEIPEITSDKVYDLSSTLGKAEFSIDIALKSAANCPDLYKLLFKR